MRQYRIIADPHLSIGDSYRIQSKGCGPFSFIWWNHKECNGYDYSTKYFWTQKEAEKRLKELRRYDIREARIIKKIGCCGEEIL